MKRFAFAVMCWFLAAGMASAAGTSFGPPHRLTLARDVTSNVAIGDANGDGRRDLAVTAANAPASQVGHKLSIFLQRSDGVLAPPLDVSLPEAWLYEYPLVFADMDGDGADEVIVGKQVDGIIVVRIAPDGTTATTNHLLPGISCKYIAAGDVDADGRIDVVCHNEQLKAHVLYGNGQGGIRSALRIFTLAGGNVSEFKSIQLADVTDDGRLDLLISASSGYSFHVHANNGAGGFLPSVGYLHPGAFPSVAIHAADIDGDGVNEVLTATPGNRPDAILNVYRRDPFGYLLLSQQIPIHDSPTALLAGPVGEAGNIGVMAAHYSFNALSVIGEDGGGLSGQFVYSLPGFGNHTEEGTQRSQYGIALGDLDGDGCNDLAAATYSGVILLYGCDRSVKARAANDFDGDGISDLLWYQPDSTELYLWQWADFDAWNNCLQPCPWSLGRRMAGQAIGDFDGDSISDVFWRDTANGYNELRLGAFYSRPITAVADLRWRAVGAGDFDGDGRSDLLWRHDRDGRNAIWRSANNLTQQPITTVTDLRWKVVGVGDFDGDGRSDIFWRHASNGRNALWRSGRNDTQIPVSSVTNMNWMVQGVGDFNGDGKDDLFWRDMRTGRNAIWLAANNGTQLPVTSVGTLDWNVVSVGDYNGDGVSDLVWRNSRTGANTIWLSANNQTQRQMSAWPTFMTVVR